MVLGETETLLLPQRCPQRATRDLDFWAERVRLFRGRISFYGGVDTQKLLPFGTADEVEREVLKRINILGSDGGYVVAASNSVQPDVPIENVLALYHTARDYRF